MFHKSKKSKDGHVRICKSCVKKYYIENRDKIIGQSRQYIQDNKDKDVEYHKQYYIDNKEKMLKHSSEYKKKNWSKIQKKYKEWCQNNRKKINTYQRERKLKEEQLPYSLTNNEWEEIKLKFNNTCCYCGNELPLQKDHFIPVSQDGECTVNNILPACKSCNASKGIKDFFEWYPEQEYFSEERAEKILNHIEYETEEHNT